MKKKIKIIFYYLLELLLSVVLFGFIALVVVKITMYDSNYVKQKFEENNYYHNVSLSIQDEMSKYIVQSGFPDDILKDIYTEEEIKNSINEMIDAIYDKDKEVTIDSSVVKDKLSSNINDYLLSNNLKAEDQAAIDRFIKQMTDIYENEISISNIVKTVDKIIGKTQKLVAVGIIGLFVLGAILIVIIKFIFKQNALSIPFLVIGLLFLFITLYINEHISVEYINIWDSNMSSLIKNIFNDVMLKFKNAYIIFLILGIVDTIIYKLFSKRKNI